jgi:hypothetical protein
MKKPILVTGCARSGTTFAGRMISKAPFVRYIHEPFRISASPCRCGIKFDYWYFYVSKHNQSRYQTHISHQIFHPFNYWNFRNLLGEIAGCESARNAVSLLKRQFISFFSNRAVIKDPLALFSAEWLEAAYNMDVIVMIRHPAAVVSSYKALNWSHPFSHFLNQPELISEHLQPFEDEIREYSAAENRDIIDQCSLLWKLTHFQIKQLQETHRNWLFVRHEDLSEDPMRGFELIFRHLGLEFTTKAKKEIQKHSAATNPTDPYDRYSIKRNSRDSIRIWEKRLTSVEIERIKNAVGDIARHFYSEEEW